jgi:beta-lactamase superfamily II metal-dependent hydrolase
MWKEDKMFQLQVIQADYGDCFILRFGDEASPKYALIDGGPKGTYENYLKSELAKIRNADGKLDLIIVSHVDDDHIYGVLEFQVEQREQHLSGNTKTLEIKSLWHNAFDATLDESNDIEHGLERLTQSTGFGQQSYAVANLACYSIKQGQQLEQIFKAHKIPINPESKNKVVSVENMPDKITNGNLSMRVVGPTEENLKELREEWLEWLKTQETGEKTKNPFFEAMADKSYANTSSIMVLAEAEEKRILFAGDGRGDHLIQGLKKTNSLDARGELYVDILKLPHHGSIRNVSNEFFDRIFARTYVISANGKHGHPDFTTLKYIVESAKRRGNRITIFATNKTPSIEKLVKEYPPAQFGYSLSILGRGTNSALLTP